MSEALRNSGLKPRGLDAFIGVLRSVWETETLINNPELMKGFEFQRSKKRDLYVLENEDNDQQYHYLVMSDEHGNYRGRWIDPNNPLDIALLNENYGEALEIAQDSVNKTPNSYDSQFDMAYTLGLNEKPDEAIKYYDQILAEKPNDIAALQNKSIELCALGRIEESQKIIEKALKIDPDDINAKILQIDYHAMDKGLDNEFYSMAEEIMKTEPSCIEDQIVMEIFRKQYGFSNMAEFARKRDAHKQSISVENEPPILH